MRSSIRFVSSVVTLIALAGGPGCGSTVAPSDTGGPGAMPGAPDAGPAGGTVIRFIHKNDLHAHLVEHATLVANTAGPPQATVTKQGGMARLATRIKALRAENPNAILMNVGDTYHGGVEALYTQGEAVAAPVNALGIDVGVPGNWDYAYGPGVTRLRYTGKAAAGIAECIQLGISSGAFGGKGGGAGSGGVPSLTAPNFPNLAANVTYKTGPIVKPGDPFLPATLMKDVAGVKVGFIGISSDIVPSMHPMLACGLTFLGADDLASGDAASWEMKYRSLIESHAQSLRTAGAAVVVVMSELGLQKDFHLANVIQAGAVDVFFSAHTHETVFTPLKSTSGALVVESGDDTYLGRMDVTVAGGKVVARDWLLSPMTDATAEDPAMKQLVDAARAPFLVADPNMSIPGNTGGQVVLHDAITKVIGTVSHPLDRKNALENSFNDFFTEALRTRAGTQLGMAPGFRMDSPIATSESLIEGDIVADGSVTVEDAYRFFPVVYDMGLAQTTGAQMKKVVEKTLTTVFSTTIPLQQGGWMEGFAGMHAQVNLAATNGSRVLAVTLPDGTAMADAGVYTIAGCRRPLDATGVLCSHAGFTNVQNFLKPDGSGQAWTNVEIFRDALTRTAAIHPTPAFTDTSGTKLWPASPYVQPLEGAK
jgi:sulfur-oxidizing protein SoxB